jgi:sugar-specific transcriptional regulator TrmB
VLFVDKEVGEMNKQPLVQCIKAAKKRMDKMSSAVRDIDDRLFTLHEEGNRCKEDIAEMKDRMIEAVTNRCAVLVSEVEEAEEKRRRDLEEHKKTLQDQMKQLEHFKSSAEDIVYDGTTREQLSVRKAMIQRASTLTSTPIPPPPPSSSSIHFVSEKREEAEKILSQVGRLSLGADPETSTMEGLTIANNTVECRPWNVPLMLKVVTRDHSGSQCAFGGENVVSVLTPTTCGVPVLGKVEDNGDGTYQVIFVSVPSEECELSVTVNGVHMKGSPVNVKMCYPNTIKQEIRGDKERRFRALVYTKQGTLLATDNKNKEVCTFAKNGEMLNSFKVQDPGGNVDGIASLSDGNIAVSLYSRNCIAVYRPNGELVKEFGSDRLNGPSGLAVNNKGQLFVAEYQGHRVSVYSENGEFQYSFGSEGSQPGKFSGPQQIYIDQDGLVYVSETGNKRIQVFQQDGRFVR